MTRDMTITVQCDGPHCDEEIDIDLDDGPIFDDDETRIEKRLKAAGWYSNMDGDYCPKHAQYGRNKWSKQ